MAARASGRRLGHYAAPVAFLAAVTIAVLLIRAGLGGGGAGAPATTTVLPSTHSTTVAGRPHRQRHKHKRPRGTAAQYYVVQSGDTFGSIAAAAGTTVARLEQLNRGVSSSSLAVGQRIRVK
jgi:hypothetical protein